MPLQEGAGGNLTAMSDLASSSIVVFAEPEAVLAVIADFETYPEWAGYFSTVEVRTRDAAGRPHHVRFVLDAGMIKDDYTVAYTWVERQEVTWTLVEAQLLTAMSGSYVLAPVDGGTEVVYRLAVDLAIPMLGLFKRKAEKVIVDTALKELKKRVEG